MKDSQRKAMFAHKVGKLKQNPKFTIEFIPNEVRRTLNSKTGKQTGSYRMIIADDIGLSDTPLFVDMYEFHKPDKVLYDHPERYPAYQKKFAESLLMKKRSNKFTPNEVNMILMNKKFIQTF